MLQSIRDRAQGMIAKFIIGFICLTFALFGVDALFGVSSTGKPVAEVNGEEIDERELNRALDLRKRRIIAQMGNEIDPAILEDPSMRARVLEEIIRRQLLLQKARELGMEFSAQQVERMLVNTPDFQVDGRFNQAVFDRAVRSQGMTPAMFRDLMRDEMTIAQLQFGLVDSGFVTNADLDAAIRLEGQTRDIAWLTISAKDQAAALEFEESELQAYYKKHAAEFMLPAQVRVAYVEIARETLAAALEIKEPDLRAAYEQEISTLAAGEERHAAHLLLQVGDDQDEEEVRARAAVIRQEIADGLSFADAVLKYSEDAGSRESAGDLGWVAKGAFGEKFDEALFALEPNVISQPVRTGFGYHLLQVSEVRTEEAPGFEELREAIETRLRRDRAAQRYAEQIEELSALAFEAGDLQEPSATLGLKIHETGFFDQSGKIFREQDAGLVSSAKFRSVAFSSEVMEDGVNSDVFEPEEGRAMVVHLRERQEPVAREFAEVRADIEDSLRRRRGAELARKLGESLLAELRADGSAGGVAARHGLEWKNQSAAMRTNPDVPPRVLDRAFSLPRPAAEGKVMDAVVMKNGDYVLLAVSGVHPGKSLDKYTNREIERLREFHANVRGSMQFTGLQKALENEAKVRKF